LAIWLFRSSGNRYVCLFFGYVLPWFKIRFGLGCFFAALAIAGVGFMIFLAITQPPPPSPDRISGTVSKLSLRG
jgi:hypothetical protein